MINKNKIMELKALIFFILYITTTLLLVIITYFIVSVFYDSQSWDFCSGVDHSRSLSSQSILS